MVEALNGRDGVDKEDLKLRTMLLREGATEWGENQALVETLRAGIMEAYGGMVLCNEIQPDPPNRGPNCEAIITLKRGGPIKKTTRNANARQTFEGFGADRGRMVGCKNG